MRLEQRSDHLLRVGLEVPAVPVAARLYSSNRYSVTLLAARGSASLTPKTTAAPEATKYWPMEMAFSLIHSGAQPAAGRSLMSSPRPPSLTIAVSGDEDAAVVHAGADVQHRRYADRLADLPQALRA